MLILYISLNLQKRKCNNKHTEVRYKKCVYLEIVNIYHNMTMLCEKKTSVTITIIITTTTATIIIIIIIIRVGTNPN